MLAANLPGHTRDEPRRGDQLESLAAALDLENGQLAGFGALVAPRLGPAGLTEYGKSPSHNALVEARLTVSKARSFAPSTAILRQHWQRKNSLEEAMLELYYGDVSVAKAEEMARLLWGENTTIATVSEYSRRIGERIRHWCQREIMRPQVYVFLQALPLKQKIDGEYRVTMLQAAIGVCEDGTREILAIRHSPAGEPDPWGELLRDLRHRGVRGTRLFVGENDPEAPAAVARHFPSARYQGCLHLLKRDLLAQVPVAQVYFVQNMLAAMHASGTKKEAAAHASALAAGLRKEDLAGAAALVERSAGFLFSYFDFPPGHWSRLQDIEPLKKTLNMFRERIRIIGPVPDEEALVLMAGARLRYVSRMTWGRRRFIVF